MIQPLKAAVLAVALLDVPLAEQHPRAHHLAVHIGQQLAAHQREDGALPFRANGQTGEWLSGESSALIFAVMLWRRLRHLGSSEFEAAETKALAWLLDGPVSTMQWIGNYEDVATARTDAGSTNLNNFDAIMTALFLIDHRGEAPAYLEHARPLKPGSRRSSPSFYPSPRWSRNGSSARWSWSSRALLPDRFSCRRPGPARVGSL